MRALRAFFLQLQIREKAFLLIFVLLILVVWGSSFNRRVQRFYAMAHATSVDLSSQAIVLSNHAKIEDDEKKAAAQLDPASTLAGTQLFAAVAAMAKEAGLQNTRSGEARDEPYGQFAFHTLQFTVNSADWDSLKRFYLAVQHRSPYIGIDQFSLNANRSNAAQLNATMRISSVEVIR